MLSVPFPQGPPSLSYVFFITSDFSTLVAVDDSNLPVLGVLIFGFNQQLFQCTIPLEMCLDIIFSINLLDAPPSPWMYGMTMWPAFAFSLGVLSLLLLLGL